MLKSRNVNRLPSLAPLGESLTQGPFFFPHDNTMPNVFDKLCGPREAAELLSVSDRTVKEWCASGKLNAEKFGRDWVIERASVAKLAKQRGKA